SYCRVPSGRRPWLAPVMRPGRGRRCRVKSAVKGSVETPIGPTRPRRSLAELARRAAVGLAEQPAEVRRAGQPPPAGDGRDRLIGESGVDQVAPAAVEPRGADEVAHTEPRRLEHAVQVAGRDET